MGSGKNAASSVAATTTKQPAQTTKPATGGQTTLKQQGCGLDNCCQHQDTCSYDDKVRLRAYQLWEEDGRPEGNDGTHYWYAAQLELTHSDVTLEQIADET